MPKKEWLEIGALALGAVSLWLVMSRGQMSGSTSQGETQSVPPNYLSYNQNNPNGIPLSNVSPIAANQLNDTTGGPLCQSCADTAIQFSGVSQFETALQNSLGDLLNTYNDNVLSEFPDYVAQFFNNNQGQGEDYAAVTRFAQLGAA